VLGLGIGLGLGGGARGLTERRVVVTGGGLEGECNGKAAVGAGRLGGSGQGWWPWCLPIAATWHGRAGDGVEEGQAVPVLHLRVKVGAPSTLGKGGGAEARPGHGAAASALLSARLTPNPNPKRSLLFLHAPLS
jgi:hypothetical protein